MTEELHTEVAFDANVTDIYPKWYDVSSHVLSGESKFGRSSEMARIETGTGSFEFDNPEGVFTPGRETLTLTSERFNAVTVAGEALVSDSGVWFGSGSSGPVIPVVTGSGVQVASTDTVVELKPDITIGAPVTPGQPVTVTVKAKVESAGVGSIVPVVYFSAGSAEISFVAGTAVTSNGNTVTGKQTFTVPAGATAARAAVQGTHSGGMLTLTVSAVSVSAPAPYAGKIVPNIPIRSFVVADNNWLSFESVNPGWTSPDGPRWHVAGTAVNDGVSEVFDATIGRDVFRFEGAEAYYAGRADEADKTFVAAGQTVTVYGVMSADSTETDPPTSFIFIDYQPVGTQLGYTAATGTAFTDRNVYHDTSATWTATEDCYVRLGFSFRGATVGVTTGKAYDLKMVIDGKGTREIGEFSGKFSTFRGTVERWSQEYHGALSTVVAECVDGMGILSRPILTQYRSGVNNWYSQNIKGTPSDGKFYYWPCVEKETPSTALPMIGGYSLNKYPGSLPDNCSAAFTTDKTMLFADGEESGGYSVVLDAAATGPWAGAALSLASGWNPLLPQWQTSFDVDFWVKPTVIGAATLWHAVTDYNNTSSAYIYLNTDGSLVFKYGPTNTANGCQLTTAPGTLKAGVLAHIGLRAIVDVATKTATVYAYVNGGMLGSSSDSVSNLDRPEIPRYERMTFAQDCGVYSAGSRTFNKPYQGIINHVSVAYGAPEGFHVAVDGFGLEFIEDEQIRLHRILDAAGWTGYRQLDPPVSSLLPARWNAGADCMDVLSGTAESAGGTIHTRNGAVVYYSRHRRVSAPVRWTVSEWSSGLRFQVDNSRIRNEITAERISGAARTVRDQESIDKYGRVSETIKRDVSDLGELADAAGWLLRRLRKAQPWCDTLTTSAHTVTGPDAVKLKALAYGAEISDRLQLIDLPLTAPADECDFFIESVSSTFSVAGGTLQWTTTLTVSDVGESTGWVLEDDTNGILDSDSCATIY